MALAGGDLNARSFPNGGGELGGLIRAFDWSATPLGPLDGWPQSLKTVTEMLLMSPVPIVLLWGEDGVMIYNDAYSGFAGGRHPELLGSNVREGWGEISDFNDNVMRVGLAGETLAYRDQELTLERHGRPEPVWMDLDYSPVLDESGKPAGVIAIVVETTERVLAERRIRDSEMRFRALVNATADIIYRMSPDWKEMRQLDGRSFLTDVDEPSIAWMDEFLLPEDVPAVQAAIDRAITAKEPFELEHRVRQADGEIGWVLSRGVPMLDEDGEIFEWFGAASDVTETHRANDHLQLVINELNHRVKNNLAMVQGIARRTFGDGDVKAAQERFAARLVALAQANDLLTGERWAGASLHGAIEQAVHPHQPDTGRYRLDGPDVRVSPKTALALSLAVHELSTNAVKYGAWSNDGGHVDVIWSIGAGSGDKRLRIEWREQGGPPVVAPHERGFGSRLIERGLAGEMGGAVALHFDPAGLRCTIDAPMTIAVEGLNVGLRVLVVEDEMTIAFLIEDILADLGHQVVDVAMRLPEAMDAARSVEIDLAILDVNLDGHQSFPVADILATRGIPFLFATGYGAAGIAPAWRDRPVLNKPFAQRDLKAAMDGIVGA